MRCLADGCEIGYSLRRIQGLSPTSLLLRVHCDACRSRELIQRIHKTREVVRRDKLLGRVRSDVRQYVKRLPGCLRVGNRRSQQGETYIPLGLGVDNVRVLLQDHGKTRDDLLSHCASDRRRKPCEQVE